MAASTMDRLSSELLGFPPDARVLIVNCDDFGMYEAIEKGVAASCSLMVPGPSAEHATGMLRRRPQLPFGIHLTMVCEAARGAGAR